MEYAAPALFALFLWWFSTGAVLYLIGLPRRTLGWTMGGATVVLALALVAIVSTRDDISTAGAYCAFTCGLLVWAWHETSFLTGVLTGPRKARLPEGSMGWQRFSYATQTLLYHEIAILLTAVLLIALTYGAPNQLAVWTFLVLWVMRLSTKLNLFLGVPNVTEDFLPRELGFLKSYFCKRPMNLLFPISVTAATVVTVLLVLETTAAHASGLTSAGYTLLATLMGLAVLEHWLLVLPLRAERLWSWGLASRRKAEGLARDKDWDGDQAGLSMRPTWTKDKAPLATLPGR